MALNFILQSSAGVISKRWCLITDENLKISNFEHERYAFVHDEQVLASPPSLAKYVAFTCKMSAAQAGEYYKLRIPIAADANIGDNWAEVH